MDTSSNIKFNVEGDDKFSQFLEKTQKSFKELNERSLKLFSAGLKEGNRNIESITKSLRTKQSIVEKLSVDYSKATVSTNSWTSSMGKLLKTTTLLGGALNALNVASIGTGILKTVGAGFTGVLESVTMTNTGINVMAASGFDGTPLMNSFNEIGAVLTGNQEAIEMFSSRATSAFNTFEQKLNEVNIVFGLSKERLAEYGDALQNGLEKNLKNSVSSLTGLNAAYQAASAGFTDFQANLEVVQLAAKANKAAPGSDLFQIGGAIGKGAGILETRDIKELELATAKWLATEQQGLTTVGEMTEYLTGMYSALKNAGIGTDQLVNETQGLVVAFTKLGAKVPEVTTQMEAFSRNTISKTPEAQKALEGLVDAQGKAITLNQEYFKDKGIVQGITDFAEAVGYNTEKIKAVYNETNAFGFVMKVLAQNGQLAKKSIEDISKVTSENLTEAFDSATVSSQAKMEQITNSYDEIMISFGKAFQKRSQEGVKSIEWYKEALVTFKEPLVEIAGKMVTFFDNVNKVTGTIGSLSKMLIGIAGTIISFRAWSLILGGITNGFKDLRKEGSVIKELYTSNQGLLSIGKQVLGLDQQKLLSQNRINEAIKGSTELEKGLTSSIGKTSAERLTSISAVQKEIDAIVARDESIIKGQQNVSKVQESLTKKTENRNTQQSEVSSTQKTLANLKTLRQDVENSLRDDEENIKRSTRLKEITAQESLIRQGNIGKDERKQLKDLNSEKLRLQDTYNKTTIDQLNSLQKQRDILNNKARKSEKDNQALAAISARERQLIDREKNKDRTPLDDSQKGKLTNVRDNLSSRITQEELVLLTQRQKLQEANNVVDKETEKLNKAKVNQQEKLNRVTKATTDLAVLQQDLNTKKNTLDRVNIAATGQQERLYTLQNALRKEQATLDKIRNKDSAEYQQQLAKVNQLQSQEATQQSTLQKARVTQQTAQQAYNKADFESRAKLRQLTREQGLAEGSLIEMQTRRGKVAVQNNAVNRALIATNEGIAKTLTAITNPAKLVTSASENLSNKIVDLRSGLGQVGAVATRNFDNMASAAKTKFAAISVGAQMMGESIKAAFISTGIGLFIGAAIGLVTKLIQVGQESAKLDKTYKDFNTTLEQSATKFDRANVSFSNGVSGLNKFSDRLENAKKLFGELEPTAFEEIGGGIKFAFGKLIEFEKGLFNFFKTITGLKFLDPLFKNLGERVSAVWTSFSDAEFLKRTEKMSQISDFIQDYELALRGQNKELEKGNLLTETSNQKIKAKMILTGEDLEREKAANSARIDSFTAMTEVQKKELEELKGKGDKLNDRDKAQIGILEAEISRREKVIEVSKKQFEEQLKYYEARNLLLDRENKFSNTQVSLEEIQTLQNQVNQSQTALNTNITEGLDIYSSSIKDSQSKSKQFLADLRDGSLSVKATLKGLGGEIYKVGEDGKVLSKLPDTVLKSIETVLKGQEIDGKKYSLEQVLNLKETRDALTDAGVEIPKDLSVLADKMRKSYESSESEIKLIDIKSLEKDLADFSVLSDQYQEKKRQFLSTTEDDIGATTFSTSLKKSLRLVETDLQTTLNALDSSSKGLNTYIMASTQKFTKQALDGTLDLTEGLKELGKVESEIEPKQLEKLKASITGQNKDEILVALKEIGIETEKTLTADSIDFNKFESNIGAFVESLNAVAESGEATSEEIAKKFETVYDQMKGKVTPAAYKSLTETLIGYEKAASEQRISLITMETNALEQQKRYGLVLEEDYIKEVNQLNINNTEENIKSKRIELKRLLSLYKETAPQVIKAKAELETLELDLKSQRSNNPVEIAKAQSKVRFDNLKKDLELGNLTRRQYIEEELKDSKNLYNVQLTEKQKTLTELMVDEVKNAKAIKALRKSMETDEKDFNLNILEINRRRIEEQFKLQTSALGKRELDVRKAAIDGNTKEEIESARKVETDKIALNIKTLEARLAIEKKGSDKFIEIERQIVEAQLSLRETQVKQTRDRVNENIESRKRELGTIAALEERNNMKGTTDKSLEKTRNLREQEVQLSIDSIKAQINLAEKGSKERLTLEQQLILEVNKLQKTQLDNDKERLEASLDTQRKLLEDKVSKLEKETIRGTTEQQTEANRKIKEDEIKNTVDSLKQRRKLYIEGTKERIALEREINNEITKLGKVQFENEKERLELSIENRRKATEDKTTKLENESIKGTTNASIEASRKLKEEEVKNVVDSLKQRRSLYKEGSKERIELERQINQEINKLQKTQFDNKKERLEASIDVSRKALEDRIAKLDKETTKGSTNDQLEASRKIKEDEVKNTIDALKKRRLLYKEGSKERLELERQINLEITKLEKTQLDNQKDKLEKNLEDRRRKLESKQIELEKATIAGTTEQEIEASRRIKETEIKDTIDSLKQKRQFHKEGTRERIALEQEIARETLKLSKQVYDNQKSRLEQQLENRKKAFRDSQLQLEKLMILGTSVEDSKKVRAAKEQEIQINIEGIKREVEAAKKGSVQRKDLERQLKEEVLKLDKQRVTNKRELIEEEITLEKTKISKIQALLERSTIGGTFEADLEKIRKLKEKEAEITINSIKKQIASYKVGSKERIQLEAELTKEVTNLQKTQFDNKRQRLEAQLEASKTKLDKQVALKESSLIDGATQEELKQVEAVKIKETQLSIDSIKKQINLYKVGSKERLVLEVSLQKEINNLQRQTLEKEKNNIQIALEFKKNKVELDNINFEKQLLKGDVTREQFEDKISVSSQKINQLQQDALLKQLKLYQKGSREYLDILKQVSQLQIDYQKSVVDKAIRDIDRITKKQNNSIEAQKQAITRQLSSSDFLTKQLQEQLKLEDSRNSVVKASSDYQVGLLEISKRTTGDSEKRAKLDVQIAELKQEALLESQRLEINSIKNNNLINQAALEREKIQISLNRLELDRSRISTEAELRKARLNKLDAASIEALQLQLDSINGQYTELSRSEGMIATQISNQAEVSRNQLQVIEQQQDLAQRNSSLEVEEAKQNVIIASYEKQLSQLRMKGSLIEANANKEKVIGDLLTKSYDAQISTLNARKELMDSTLSSIDSLYGIEQSMAKSDLTKEKLAREQAKDRLTFLDFQQRMERESFDLEKAKNKIVRERQKVELNIAEINARQALATSKAEQTRTNARKDATEEEKLAARLAVESAEQGILAAKANKEISLELAALEEKTEKNKEAINARNQRNQRLQAEQAYAQTTTNTLDDREVAGQARRFRLEDERSISNNLAPTSNNKVDNIISDFLSAMNSRKPIVDTVTTSPYSISADSSPKTSFSRSPQAGLPTINTTSPMTSNTSTTNTQGGSIESMSNLNTGLTTISSSLEKLLEISTNTTKALNDKGDTIKQGIEAFKLSVDKNNQARKKDADAKHKENLRDNDRLYKSIEELIDVIEEHIEKGGKVTINSPITVEGGASKDPGLQINKHLYDLATKVERKQKK